MVASQHFCMMHHLAAGITGGEVVQFLFQQLRAAYGELSDDDFKAMVLMALDEGTHIAED